MMARLPQVPPALLACGVAAAGGAAVGWFAGGVAAALGAVAGVGLVVVSYLFSTFAIAWADSVNPRLVLPVGMAAYVTKFGLFGLGMIFMLDRDWAGTTALAWGIVAGVVAWTGAQIWWVSTKGKPRYESPAS